VNLAALESLQSLYDQNRFLEAYRQSAEYWTGPPNPERFSSDELILGARLARRLGGFRLSRWLFLAASEREPESPRVCYFASARRGRTLLDELREREAKLLLDTDDPNLQASWLAGSAVLWASLRDFSRAHDCIERAKGYDRKDGWVWSCESDVFAMEDRLEEALTAAELGWKLSPGAPYAAHGLGSTLLKLGRVKEAAERLHAVARECESYEVVTTACWHHAALAETLEGQEKRDVVLRARALAERLSSLTPLADRETRSVFARIRADVAQLGDDRAQMERSAKEVRAPFFSKMVENLRKNPRGSRIRLSYRRQLQRHVTCLPTSLATALGAMGVSIDADDMAAEVTYGGTSDWAAAEWLQKRGFEVRGFIVTPELASSLIRNGIAFVLSLEADDFAHAVAIVGLDEAAGTLIVHDPMEFRTTEYLLDLFGQLAPLGPHGMAAVPRERAPLLDELLNPVDVEVISAWMSYHRALQLYGPTIASAFVAQIGQKHPSHPVTRLLQATEATEDGRAGEALAGYQELLKEFPSYPSVRARLLLACRTLGNTALFRDTLASVVERGIVPGAQSQQDWLHPPSGYVSQYADLLRFSAATAGRARALLHGVLRRAPASADAWHVLADMLWHNRNVTDALIAYRIASCLAESNEHYASAYCDALGAVGRVDEGLAWLERRVRAHGSATRATGAWIQWIEALENWGRPEEALAAADEALRRHEHDPALLSYATTFLGRMGRWEEAESLLSRLKDSGNPAFFHEAAVHVHILKGDLDEAVRHAEAWVRERPLSLLARRTLLDRIAARDGSRKALDLAERWRAAHRGHDTFEELCAEYLSLANEPPWKKALLLRRRLKRNREDGWAWRELAFLYLQDHDSSSEKRRARLVRRISAVIAQCERIAPLEPSTLRAKAVWSQQNGKWKEAVDGWLESIDHEPGTPHGYRNAWNCSATFNAAARLEVWQRMETLLLAYPGRLQAAREVAQLAAQRFGVAFAEEAVTRWKSRRPEDPEITEAAADLLLEYGHGRTDVERALGMLEPAVQRYPFHLALRFSLLRAYRSLGRFADAEGVVREIVRRHPSNAAGLIQLAWVHELGGRDGEALRVLETAIRRDPQNTELTNALVQIHFRNGRLDQVQRIVEETLKRLPTNVYWRERSIQFLLQCGKEEAALEVARDGVAAYPGGAYLWYLLGDALDQLRHLASQGELERCFRKSLELNQALFDSADHLATLLATQRRFQEAEEVVRRVATRMGDPCAARGRLAWIHREEGRKQPAVEEMAETLVAAPWYQWGWAVLMEWLTEDESWDLARSLLREVPPEIRTSPLLLKDRLKLLEKAGLGEKELDGEWSRLLSDFPEDHVLHKERYDSLRNRNRFPEAAEVLRKIQHLDRDDPFMNARLVEVLAHEHKREEALEVLLRVLFATVERSEWPAAFAWHTVRSAGFADLAFERVYASLKDGFRPTPHALALWCSYALETHNTQGQKPRSVPRIWFPDAGARKVLALLEGKQEAVWMDGRYRARLLGTLCDYGYDRRVARYWRKHRAEVESDVDSWAQTARALIRLGRHREARKLMAKWRERPGVTLWMIGNYVGCFSGIWTKSLSEVQSICRDALSGLPHDHSTRYLVHVQAEASALLGDEDAFRATCEEHQTYFDGELSDEEWFRDDRRHLLEDIPALAACLKDDRRWPYRATLWRLRSRHVQRGVLSSTFVRAVRKIPLAIWWLAFILTCAWIANL
jgi:predicted Zn-dependent protease